MLEPTSAARRRQKRVVETGLVFYALALLAGLELGYRYAGGSHSRRLLIALFSGLAGYGLAYLAVMVAVVVIHIRRARRPQDDPS
jgi:hypothetical protein